MPDFAVTITNANVEQDAQAATLAVERENERRVVANANAGLSPGDPGYLDALPTSPAGQLLASYITTMETQIVPNIHIEFQQQAAQDIADQNDVRERWRISSDAQRAAAAAQLEPLP